jgi:His-Xaa-Ser system protein HxsD
MNEDPSRDVTTLLTFDGRVFGLLAIKKAAYRYIDRFSADFTVEGDNVNCRLHFTSATTDASRSRIVDDFRKEILDQDLRERIKLETEPVRNLILAHAFSKTGIASDEQISED